MEPQFSPVFVTPDSSRCMPVSPGSTTVRPGVAPVVHGAVPVTVGRVILRLHYVPVTSRGSDKPVCHGGAKVRYGYPRSITIISTFYYGLLRFVAVSCVLTKA